MHTYSITLLLLLLYITRADLNSTPPPRASSEAPSKAHVSILCESSQSLRDINRIAVGSDSHVVGANGGSKTVLCPLCSEDVTRILVDDRLSSGLTSIGKVTPFAGVCEREPVAYGGPRAEEATRTLGIAPSRLPSRERLQEAAGPATVKARSHASTLLQSDLQKVFTRGWGIGGPADVTGTSIFKADKPVFPSEDWVVEVRASDMVANVVL